MRFLQEYTKEMQEADNLIDYIKENEEGYTGLAIYDPNSDDRHSLVTTVVGPPLPLAAIEQNIFSKYSIVIEEAKILPKDLEVYIGTKTGYPDYNLYKNFIAYAYENLRNKDKGKVFMTPKYILVPYGPEYRDYEKYSTFPGYLVYER